jgi:hypothetical protein
LTRSTDRVPTFQIDDVTVFAQETLQDLCLALIAETAGFSEDSCRKTYARATFVEHCQLASLRVPPEALVEVGHCGVSLALSPSTTKKLAR